VVIALSALSSIDRDDPLAGVSSTASHWLNTYHHHLLEISSIVVVAHAVAVDRILLVPK
jgi:hypothetical protein